MEKNPIVKSEPVTGFNPNVFNVQIVSTNLDRKDTRFEDPVELDDQDVRFINIRKSNGRIYKFPVCNIHSVEYTPLPSK